MREQAAIVGKYQILWGEVRDWVRAGGSGERTLAEALHGAFLRTNNAAGGDTVSPPLPDNVEFFLNGTRAPTSLIAREYLLRDLYAESVMRDMHVDTDVIVELGAGWSANLFTLFLRGAPSKARYFGCELTEAGREAGAALAAVEPRMRYKAVPYDWTRPDYTFMPQDAQHVIVYSCYSIEQIPHLVPEVFTRLLEATKNAKTVRGVHMEPLGFQYGELTPTPQYNEEGRAYALRKSYNLNARELFDQLAAANVLRVKSVAPDAYGYVTQNLSTVVRWERP